MIDPRPKANPATKERVTLCCNDCPAEVETERATRVVVQATPQGPVPRPFASVRKPPGWTDAYVQPEGKPVIVGGAAMIDVWHDSTEAIATKTQTPQPVFRCPACSERSTTLDAVRSAGLAIVGADGRPVL